MLRCLINSNRSLSKFCFSLLLKFRSTRRRVSGCYPVKRTIAVAAATTTPVNREGPEKWKRQSPGEARGSFLLVRKALKATPAIRAVPWEAARPQLRLHLRLSLLARPQRPTRDTRRPGETSSTAVGEDRRGGPSPCRRVPIRPWWRDLASRCMHRDLRTLPGTLSGTFKLLPRSSRGAPTLTFRTRPTAVTRRRRTPPGLPLTAVEKEEVRRPLRSSFIRRRPSAARDPCRGLSRTTRYASAAPLPTRRRRPTVGPCSRPNHRVEPSRPFCRVATTSSRSATS